MTTLSETTIAPSRGLRMAALAAPTIVVGVAAIWLTAAGLRTGYGLFPGVEMTVPAVSDLIPHAVRDEAPYLLMALALVTTAIVAWDVARAAGRRAWVLPGALTLALGVWALLAHIDGQRMADVLNSSGRPNFWGVEWFGYASPLTSTNGDWVWAHTPLTLAAPALIALAIWLGPLTVRALAGAGRLELPDLADRAQQDAALRADARPALGAYARPAIFAVVAAAVLISAQYFATDSSTALGYEPLALSAALSEPALWIAGLATLAAWRLAHTSLLAQPAPVLAIGALMVAAAVDGQPLWLALAAILTVVSARALAQPVVRTP